MRRITTAIALLLLTASPLPGQIHSVAASPTRPAPPKAPKGPKLTELTVHPAPAPAAALDYRLLPELLDQTPGDAAPLYFLAQQTMPERDRWDEKLRKWQDVPLDKLPADEAHRMLSEYRTPLRQIELAGRRETCDWGLPIRSEGISLVIPPMSAYRTLARVLLVKARLEIAAGNYDQAVQTLQTGYAMGRHVAEGRTLIHALVAVAISALLNEGVEDLMEAKGGPNLYWALAEMPRPTISLRKALRSEGSLAFFQSPTLRKAHKGKLTPAEIRRLPEEFGKAMMWYGVATGGREERNRAIFAAVALTVYPQAKKHLATKGYTPEQIKAMPVAQVVSMYSLGRYMYWRGELFKWFSLPYWQAHEGIRRTNAAFAKVSKSSPAEGFPFTMLLPSLSRSYFMSARLDRRIAALQTIEAVRMYAAKEGKLPAKLGDIIDAPAPIDPVTGKQFQYEVKGRTFTLTGPAPPGMTPDNGAVYRVTLAK